jgi:hypothetical protein
MRALHTRDLDDERARREMRDAVAGNSSGRVGSGALLLAPSGLPLRCGACRHTFDADADYFEFRCSAGCLVALHLGACRRYHAELFRKAHNGAVLHFKAGIPCLTALADAAACAGRGVSARQPAGGAKSVLFDEREAHEKRVRAAAAQAAAEAQQRRAAQAAAAAAAAAAVALSREERRAELQRRAARADPSVPREEALPPEALLNRPCVSSTARRRRRRFWYESYFASARAGPC